MLLRRKLGLLVVAFPVLYLIAWYLAPMTLSLVYSFWRFDNRPIPGFALDNYVEIFKEPILFTTFVRTVWVSLSTVVLAVLLGYPAAYFLAKKVHRYQQLLVILAISPLWTSYLVRNFAWIPMLSRKGFINTALLSLGIIHEPVSWLLFSPAAVTIVMVGVYLPYMILPTYSVLERLDDHLLEAAWDLGASGWGTLINVILPLSRAGLAVGCLFVFVLSMGSYVTPELIGGTSSIMVGSQIATQFVTLGNYPLGSAIALLVMAIVLILASQGLRAGRLGEIHI